MGHVLRALPPVTVLGVFPAAVYLQTAAEGPGGGGVVALVTSDALRLPCSAVLAVQRRAAPFECVAPGATGRVGDLRLSVCGVEVHAARWWRPRRPRPHPARVDPVDLVDLVDRLGPLITQACPDLRAGTRRAPTGPGGRFASALVRGDHTAAVEAADRLVGLGPGLTPSGDDVLAGVLVTLHGLRPDLADRLRGLGGEIARRACGRTTALAATLLGQAAQGYTVDPLLDVVDGLSGQPSPLTPAVVGRLTAVGHTSGRDLLLGVVLATEATAQSRGHRKDVA